MLKVNRAIAKGRQGDVIMPPRTPVAAMRPLIEKEGRRRQKKAR